MTLSGITPADDHRRQFVHALESGSFEELFDVIFERIMSSQNTIAGVHETQAEKAMWRVLLYTDARILKCLLEGNIAKESKQNNEVEIALSALYTRVIIASQLFLC